MIPVKEIKKDVAKWMGIYVKGFETPVLHGANKVSILKTEEAVMFGISYCKDTKSVEIEKGAKHIPLKEWTPEKGGKDLTEVLTKLDKKQDELLWDILHDISGYDLLDTLKWFQNPDNAETILRAVAEVIK